MKCFVSIGLTFSAKANISTIKSACRLRPDCMSSPGFWAGRLNLFALPQRIYILNPPPKYGFKVNKKYLYLF